MSREPSGREPKSFVQPLPPNPNLDRQRKLAKALARDYWRGKAEAVERVRALHLKPPAPEDFVLADAQLVIARGYGFASWPQMKRKIESLTKSAFELFKAAVNAGDVDHVRQLLRSHPVLVSKINAPIFSFGSSAVHVARTNLDLLDLLLAHGGDLNARTSWNKGGFGVLEQVEPDEAAPLIARGARIDVRSIDRRPSCRRQAGRRWRHDDRHLARWPYAFSAYQRLQWLGRRAWQSRARSLHTAPFRL